LRIRVMPDANIVQNRVPLGAFSHKAIPAIAKAGNIDLAKNVGQMSGLGWVYKFLGFAARALLWRWLILVGDLCLMILIDCVNAPRVIGREADSASTCAKQCCTNHNTQLQFEGLSKPSHRWAISELRLMHTSIRFFGWVA